MVIRVCDDGFLGYFLHCSFNSAKRFRYTSAIDDDNDDDDERNFFVTELCKPQINLKLINGTHF